MKQELNPITLTFRCSNLEKEFSRSDNEIKGYLLLSAAVMFFLEYIAYIMSEGFELSLFLQQIGIVVLGILGCLHPSWLLPVCSIGIQFIVVYFFSQFVLDHPEMTPQRAFMNGQTIGTVFLLGTKSFVIDAFGIILSQGFIVYLCNPGAKNYIDFIHNVIIYILMKYISYSHARHSFLNAQKVNQWHEAVDKLFENNIFITKFEPRTCNIFLQECNQQARRFGFHENADKFREFISKVKVNLSRPRKSNVTSNMPTTSTFSTASYHLKHKQTLGVSSTQSTTKTASAISPQQQFRNSNRFLGNSSDFTLKDYLISKFSEIAEQKQHRMENTGMRCYGTGEELVGYYENNYTVVKLKLKVGMMMQEQPLLIITFNDRIDEDNISALKRENRQLRTFANLSLTTHQLHLMLLLNSSHSPHSHSRNPIVEPPTKANINLPMKLSPIAPIGYFVRACSLREAFTQLFMKQQNAANRLNILSLSTISISQLMNLAQLVYPSIKINSLNQNISIYSDLTKVKFVFFSVISRLAGLAYPSLKQEDDHSSPQISLSFEQKRNSLFQSLEVRMSRQVIPQVGSTTVSNQNSNTSSCSSSPLMFSIGNPLLHIQGSQGSTQQSAQQIGDKLCVQIEDETVKYYLALLGPRNCSIQRTEQISDLPQQTIVTISFEIFSDMRIFRNEFGDSSSLQQLVNQIPGTPSSPIGTSAQIESLQIMEVNYEKQSNISMHPNNTPFNREIILESPHFISYSTIQDKIARRTAQSVTELHSSSKASNAQSSNTFKLIQKTPLKSNAKKSNLLQSASIQDQKHQLRQQQLQHAFQQEELMNKKCRSTKAKSLGSNPLKNKELHSASKSIFQSHNQNSIRPFDLDVEKVPEVVIVSSALIQ